MRLCALKLPLIVISIAIDEPANASHFVLSYARLEIGVILKQIHSLPVRLITLDKNLKYLPFASISNAVIEQINLLHVRFGCCCIQS